MNHSQFLGLKNGMSLAACMFVVGCTGNKAYLVNPPPGENVVKMAQKVEIKNRVSRPTKSFPSCRKLANSTAEHPASLTTLLLVPVDFIILPYTAVYDLSPHYDVEKKVNLKLKAKLLNASGVPLGDYPLTIKANGVQSVKVNTDSDGIFTADLLNLAGNIGEKVPVTVLLSDADLAPFAKGQPLSIVSPMEVEYLVTVGDGRLSVERTDRYVRVQTASAPQRDTLWKEHKAVRGDLQGIVVEQANLLSEKNRTIQKQEEVQRQEDEARQREEALRVKKEEDLKKQKAEAERLEQEKKDRLLAERRLKKEIFQNQKASSSRCMQILQNIAAKRGQLPADCDDILQAEYPFLAQLGRAGDGALEGASCKERVDLCYGMLINGYPVVSKGE